MKTGGASRAEGLPNDAQNEPIDLETYQHQAALLKSLHCARPVLYQGRNEFIRCVTANTSGSPVDMVVYLAGKRDSVDSTEVQIKPAEGKSKADENDNE